MPMMPMTILMGGAPLKACFAIRSLGLPFVALPQQQSKRSGNEGSPKGSPLNRLHIDPNLVRSMPMLKLINSLNGVPR